MANPAFDPEKVLGDKITKMDKQELCEFVAALCRKVVMEVGVGSRRGGIYPDNISVNENGTICIGEAGKMPLQGQELDFAAPEVYREGTLSAASDVYSVGMLMYYAFAEGKLPLEGECEEPQLRRMDGGDFPAPKAAGRRIGEIIEKAIRFKAAERYQSLDEMRSVLDSCIKNLYLSGADAALDKDGEEMSELGRMMLGLDAAEQEHDGQSPEEEQEDVKLYTPAKKNEQKEVISAQQSDMLAKRFSAQGSPAVPKLDEEDDDDDEDEDELEPVSPLRHELKTPAVQYATRNIERERKIAEEVKKRRRRPLAVILVLCAVLVMVAIVMNAMLKDFQQAKNMPDNPINPVMSVDPYASTMPPVTPEGQGLPVDNDPIVLTPEPSAVPTPTPAPVVEHSYEVVKADVSWTQAQQAAYDKGGHLVVINDAEEFNKIIYEAELAGITRVWIGCHRINGIETWEKENSGYAIPWAKGEPTYVDVNDQVSEDYVMLWNNNGWACNDNRDDPCKDYPDFYSGTMGYVIEYGD